MRFAHFADAHPGFQKTAAFRDLERKAFGGAIEGRISREADFVPVCGDLFHVNIPEMRVRKRQWHHHHRDIR